MAELAKNRDAVHKYQIKEKYEVGIELTGHEVKSVKEGNLSLKGSYVTVKGEELYLINAHIGSFQPHNAPANYDPTRTRRLLLKKQEIRQILGKRSGEGLTAVPLRAYTSRGRIKIEIGVARSKTKADKRETLKKRDANREIERAMRGKE